MGVEMLCAIGMSVGMEMHASAPQAVQHLRAQQHQHDAYREFQCQRRPLRQDQAQHQHGTSEQQQRERMTSAPGHALPNRVAE